MKRQRSAWRVVSILLAMTGTTSCGRADQAGLATSSNSAPAPCFDSEPAKLPAFWNQRVSVSLKVGSFSEAIERFNADLDLPISFIEGRAETRLPAFVADNEPASEVLRRVLESAPGYQCKVAGRHVVVLSDAAAYAATVHGVRIVSEYRNRASRAYVDRLAKQVSAFGDLGFFGGGSYLGDSPLVDEKVTLAQEATVLEHLSQLLGDDPKVYFWIRWAATGTRYLTLGSVP